MAKDAHWEDDQFLTQLSQGTDPSGGQDQLAQLLLDLRADVMRPTGPAPLLLADDLATARARRTRRMGRVGSGHWAAGLVGMAAGIVAVAGVGAVINAADPGSPLYPARTALFGSSGDARVVELASTLAELQTRTERGDIDGAKQLITQAREQLDKDPAPVAKPATVTVTAPAVSSAPVAPPVTVTEQVSVPAAPAVPVVPGPAGVTVTTTVFVPQPGPVKTASATAPAPAAPGAPGAAVPIVPPPLPPAPGGPGVPAAPAGAPGAGPGARPTPLPSMVATYVSHPAEMAPIARQATGTEPTPR